MFKTLARIFLLVLGAAFSFPQFSRAQNSPHVPGELLVAPKAGIADAELENEYKAHGGQKIKTLSQIKVHHIKVPAHALDAIETALRKNPNVEYVEKNFIGAGGMVPNDPGYASQWHLPKISAPQGWDISTGSSNV
jgi:thermitase